MAAAARDRRYEIATPLLLWSAGLHLRHITEGGDPFESTTARPLDFGHWSAHKLEQMTKFRLRHGEAVAIGVALDVVYCAVSGLLDWDSAERVLRCLRELGFRLWDDTMTDTATLLEGLEEFRQHLGGTLTVTLIEGIGRPIEVHELSTDCILAAIEHLSARRRRKVAH
jgi:3-dehydroquinate synthase